MKADLPSLPDPISNETTPANYEYFHERKKLGWNLEPEFQELVHPFWLTFDAPDPAVNYMLGSIYIIFLVSSLVGNGVVIWIFACSKSLRTPSNMFVINLAIFDFIMMAKSPIFIMNSFNQGPTGGKLYCDIFAIIGTYSGIGAAVSNAAIAYDRYKTIAKPFEPKLSRAQALLSVLGIWLYATPWAVLPYLRIWGRFVPDVNLASDEGLLTSCSFDYMTEDDRTRSFVVTLFICAFVIPATAIIFFYSKVYAHVREHEIKMKEQAKKMNVSNLRSATPNDKEMSAEIRILKVSITLFALYVISWGPYASVALIVAFGDRTWLTPYISMVPALTCKAVACIDPWVYAINHPKYRIELQKKIPWFCVHEPEDNSKSCDGSSVTTEKE